ncbi:11585_t:CDS:2, partial [Cetraspora pellucida]
DKRKKEWILFKKEEKLHIGKTIRKTKKSVMIMHWNKNVSSTERQSFLKKEEKDLIFGVPITAYTKLREIVEDCNFEQKLNPKDDRKESIKEKELRLQEETLNR